MKESQKFSFERNRYYGGKMLTSKDFQLEQKYVNNKRRFINRVMFGKGIVWGCNVNNLDDLSLMVESGAVIDAWGREIIIPEAYIVKLSAIEGFRELESQSAYLCVVYDEEEVNPVYAARQGEEILECNHIMEKYRLLLVDELDMEDDFSVESEFFTESILFKNQDYILKIIMPAIVCIGNYVKIVFELQKSGDGEEIFSYKGTFRMTDFTDVKGKNEYTLNIDSTGMLRGDIKREELWAMVSCNEKKNVNIVLQPGTAEGYIEGVRVDACENLVLDIAAENISPRELVDIILGKTNLEMRTMTERQEYVKLAKINLIITEQGYMIKNIEEKSVKRYIETPADGSIRSEMLECFSLYRNENSSVSNEISECAAKGEGDKERYMEGGVFDIPLGKGAKKGEIFYSENISCGTMGKNVYIKLGFDVEEAGVREESNITIFGDGDIFRANKKDSRIPVVDSAIKIYRDKGIFQAGIKFLRDYDGMFLRCRWIAAAGEEIKDISGEGKKKWGYIVVEKSTLVMKPKESAALQIKYVDMEPCPVAYAVNERGSGWISENGVYTAPESEGVYEINVYCTERPDINAFCYAVVRV